MAKAFVKDLATYIRAGYPIVTIVSSEEDRALELVDELLRQKEMWKRPRKLDLGWVFAGLVGESEERMRKALELEELVINALYEAYADAGQELRTEHLLKSAGEIIPLARSRARDVAALRQWAATNCRQAAEAETAEASAPTDTVAGRRARMVDL